MADERHRRRQEGKTQREACGRVIARLEQDIDDLSELGAG